MILFLISFSNDLRMYSYVSIFFPVLATKPDYLNLIFPSHREHFSGHNWRPSPCKAAEDDLHQKKSGANFMWWLWDLCALCSFLTPSFLHEHHLFSIFSAAGVTTVAVATLENSTVNDQSWFCIWGVRPTIRPRYVRLRAACIWAQSYSHSRLYGRQIPSVDEGIPSRGITKWSRTLFVISITYGESFRSKSRRGRAHLSSCCSLHGPWGGAGEAARRPQQGQKGEHSVPCSKSLPLDCWKSQQPLTSF